MNHGQPDLNVTGEKRCLATVLFLPFRFVKAHEARRTALIEACNSIAREVLYSENLYSCGPNTRKRKKNKPCSTSESISYCFKSEFSIEIL